MTPGNLQNNHFYAQELTPGIQQQSGLIPNQRDHQFSIQGVDQRIPLAHGIQSQNHVDFSRKE